MQHERDIDFLFEIGSQRNVPRGWRQHIGFDVASNLEHTMRVVFLALLISRKMKQGDENLITKMALLHDLPETRTSDLSYIQKVYVEEHEEEAIADMFAGTLFEQDVAALKQYKARESIEAKIVKDADNLDIDLELAEFIEMGSQLAAKWVGFRRKVRDEKLYTDAAKELWDEIQKSDVAHWHLTANKWVKLPQAGK